VVEEFGWLLSPSFLVAAMHVMLARRMGIVEDPNGRRGTRAVNVAEHYRVTRDSRRTAANLELDESSASTDSCDRYSGMNAAR